jgi:hypothetical protein
MNVEDVGWSWLLAPSKTSCPIVPVPHNVTDESTGFPAALSPYAA